MKLRHVLNKKAGLKALVMLLILSASQAIPARAAKLRAPVRPAAVALAAAPDAKAFDAASRLTRLRVAHELMRDENGHWIVRIKRIKDSKRLLNRLAHTLWIKHRTMLAYDPARLAKREAIATYRAPQRGRRYGIIQLPSASIANPSKLNSSLAHEIIHSLTIWRLRHQKPYDFYGRVTSARATTLPHSEASYAKSYSFDEIDAYYTQASVLIREGKPGRAVSRALRGQRLALRTRLIANEALRQLARGEIAARSRKMHRIVKLSIGSSRLMIKIPAIAGETVESRMRRLRDGADKRATELEALIARLRASA